MGLMIISNDRQHRMSILQPKQIQPFPWVLKSISQNPNDYSFLFVDNSGKETKFLDVTSIIKTVKGYEISS